jgi:hypothetical protein
MSRRRSRCRPYCSLYVLSIPFGHASAALSPCPSPVRLAGVSAGAALLRGSGDLSGEIVAAGSRRHRVCGASVPPALPALQAPPCPRLSVRRASRTLPGRAARLGDRTRPAASPRTWPGRAISVSFADRVKTHVRNDFAEYFSVAAGIPVPNNMNVRCLSEFHLDIPRAAEIYALEIFRDRVFTQSA